MATRTTRTTAYGEYVFTNLASSVRSGAGLYNYDELAAMVGLKPTHNFRRRVRQMVAEGILQLVPAFTPRGGIEARFQTPTNEQKEMPF